MARQRGPVKVQGTIGDLNFYKSQDVFLLREKGGVDEKRIKKDPAFQRTREFGSVGKAGKVIRTALRPNIFNADNRVVSRLHQQLMKVIQADPTSIRGSRYVTDGDIVLLADFEFNSRSPLGSTFFVSYTGTINRVPGTIVLDIPVFIPTDMVIAPSGATHFKIISDGAEIDFVNRTFVMATDESAVLPWSAAPTVDINQSHQVTAASTNPLFLVLCIAFYQEVNGELYMLHNGTYNSSAVLRVSKV